MTGGLSPLSILKRLCGLCCILWGGQSVGACARALGCTGVGFLVVHPRCSSSDGPTNSVKQLVSLRIPWQ
jgi:hypothetical protein